MKKSIWMNKTDSFDKARKFNDDYYISMSSEERLETVQFLRETYFKMKKGPQNESGKRLRRIIRVIKQT